MWMIHDPWTFAIGNAADLRKAVDQLDKTGGVMLDTYAKKTGQSAEQIKAWMAEETWMTSQEAKDRGFTDEVLADSGDEAEADDAAVKCQCGVGNACDAACVHAGTQCSTLCTCGCETRVAPEADDNESMARSANPILSRYKNTPEPLRAKVTSRALLNDVKKRLAPRQASLPNHPGQPGSKK
jgi:hypothetical protein